MATTTAEKLFKSEEVENLRGKMNIGRTTGTAAMQAAENEIPKQGGGISYLPEEGVIFFDPSGTPYQNPKMNNAFVTLAVAQKSDGSSYPFEFYLNSIVKTFCLCDKEGHYVDEEGKPSESQVWITTKGSLIDAYNKCKSVKEIYNLLAGCKNGVKVTCEKKWGISRNFRTGVESPKEMRNYTYDIL